jgi:SAM-dependent methyltransferase
MSIDTSIHDKFEKLSKETGWQNWYQKFEVVKGSGVFTPGHLDVQGYTARMKWLDLGENYFNGKRVLDIGAFSGAFSFFLEDLGADVLSVDVFNPDMNGFNIVHKVRRSKVVHKVASVYDLNPVDFGFFDIVAFFGVFYHLKHPLLALERINSVLEVGGLCIGSGSSCDSWYHNENMSCEEGADFSSITIDKISDEKICSVNSINELPICGFSPVHYIRDDSNWFIPNKACLESWLATAGLSVQKMKCTTSRLDRDWNVNDIKRSTLLFKAIKTSDPKPEYTSPYMEPYTIPTSFELNRMKGK